MANISVERDGLADGMPRDERGLWRPDKDVGAPNPVFSWPPKPIEAAKWLKGYMWPFNMMYFIVVMLTWLYLTPEMSRMTEFRADWMLEIFAAQPNHVDHGGGVLHLSTVDAEGAGLSVQVVAELDEQESQIPLERSSARQYVLEHRQRRHHLDGL